MPGIRRGLGLRTGIPLWACFPPAPSEEVWGLIKGLVPSQLLFARTTWGGSLVYLGRLLTLSFSLSPEFPIWDSGFPTLHLNLSTSLFLPPLYTLFLTVSPMADAPALLKSLGFPRPSCP